MKWVEIITLRSLGEVSRQLVEELLSGLGEADSPTTMPNDLMEIRVYHHSVVETDLSIHIYWRSKPGNLDKSSLALRFSSALKSLGLLNHSVWVETTAVEFPADYDYVNDRSGDIVASAGSKAGESRQGG